MNALLLCSSVDFLCPSAEWVIELIGNKLKISSSAKEWRSVELILIVGLLNLRTNEKIMYESIYFYVVTRNTRI